MAGKVEVFPSEQNYGQLLEEMLQRKSRPYESIEIYYIREVGVTKSV